jgi:hypothetical protein
VDAVSGTHENFWDGIPAQAMHPTRVLMIEALWWIGEPLSPIGLVDVLGGFLSMWEALHHLRVLEVLDVVEPIPAPTGKEMGSGEFYVPYRLRGQEAGDES